MKNAKTQGIILRSRNYSDYDQILTVFTRDFGKIKVMAKGVRRSKSKNRGGTQVFSLVQMELYRGKNFFRLIQSHSVKSFIEIRESYDKLLAASEWTEVLDQLISGEEADPSLFSLAVSGLTYLAYQETGKTLVVFEAKLLYQLGYLAPETSCQICNNQEKLYFTNRGDCFCENCQEPSSKNYLDKAALKTLCFFISQEPEQIQRLKVSDQTLSLIALFLHNRISAHLGRELVIFGYPNHSIDIKS